MAIEIGFTIWKVKHIYLYHWIIVVLRLNIWYTFSQTINETNNILLQTFIKMLTLGHHIICFPVFLSALYSLRIIAGGGAEMETVN